MYSLSIIIPVFNESEIVFSQLQKIKSRLLNKHTEILVIDGGSDDNTVVEAQKANVAVLHSPKKGRAAQMNFGAENAKGEILYFLHIDTLPPKHFDQMIIDAVKNGFSCGCFRMKFNSESKFLAFWAYFTRFNYYICRGGDQSLFITKKLFWQLGGFDTKKQVGEDMDFFKKIYRKKIKFKVIPGKVITSARKYEQIGTWKLQWLFARIHLMLIFGKSQDEIIHFYNRKIKAYVS